MLTNSRIHVERVIGEKKEFSLLSATQVIDFVASPDESKIKNNSKYLLWSCYHV